MGPHGWDKDFIASVLQDICTRRRQNMNRDKNDAIAAAKGSESVPRGRKKKTRIDEDELVAAVKAAGIPTALTESQYQASLLSEQNDP